METKGLMRPLTEEELHNIYGGSIFTKIIDWFKRRFFHENRYVRSSV